VIDENNEFELDEKQPEDLASLKSVEPDDLASFKTKTSCARSRATSAKSSRAASLARRRRTKTREEIFETKSRQTATNLDDSKSM
jgi:hypothetical protein